MIYKIARKSCVIFTFKNYSNCTQVIALTHIITYIIDGWIIYIIIILIFALKYSNIILAHILVMKKIL